MAGRFARLHAQAAVEQENALPRPGGQIAAFWRRHTAVCLQLRQDIAQRRRQLHARLHGKGQPVGLPRLVIRVLPQDHDPHRLRRCEPEGGEQRLPRRIDRGRGIGRVHPLCERPPVRLFEFPLQKRLPRAEFFRSHGITPYYLRFFRILSQYLYHRKTRNTSAARRIGFCEVIVCRSMW